MSRIQHNIIVCASNGKFLVHSSSAVSSTPSPIKTTITNTNTQLQTFSTMRSGAFCKSECIVTRLVTLTIWKNDWFMNCATLIILSLTEQSSSSNSIS